jgi:uncharacterized repeat protein (TIGR03806 family)
MRWLVLGLLALAGCYDRPLALPECRPADYLTHPPQQLSEYCVLQNQGGKVVPAVDAIPYNLNTPLFSDYALKTRLVWIPPGTHVEYDGTNAFDLPIGSIVAKTFAFAKDYRHPDQDVRLVETRILLRAANGWTGLPYVWNDAQDDATLAADGQTTDLAFVDAQGAARSAHYRVASEFECHSCHDSGDGIPQLIGPSARQLNRDYAYPAGSENQLAHWAKLGILAAAPDPASAPRLPVWNDPATGTVEARARAYLEGNCAHCHNAGGLSQKTGLWLRFDETDSTHLGICKPTGKPEVSGGFSYDVVPGDPDHSALIFRLASVDPNVMMPQIGRSVVHTEGLALVRQWIAQLPGSCP